MWLGSNEIQSSENRIAIPHQVIEINIVEKRLPVHWILVEKVGEVAISKEAIVDGGSQARDFNENVELERLTHTTLGENRVATIPKKFFSEFKGKSMGSRPVPSEFRFSRGRKCHFITNRQLWQSKACFVIQDEGTIMDIMENGSETLLTDGGEPDDNLIPEADIDHDQAFILEREAIVDIDTAKSLLRGNSSHTAEDESQSSTTENRSTSSLAIAEFGPDLVVDARDCIAGRVAAQVAELALGGEKIAVVNSEHAVITGEEQEVDDTIKSRRSYSSRPSHRPRPDRLLKRSIRGMLPMKNVEGREAMENIRVFVGNPLDDKETVVLDGTSLGRLSNIKFTKLGELSANSDEAAVDDEHKG